jgi:glycosyltransferase involved in cell wall biosynthesis
VTRVSVVVPARNSEATLPALLAALGEQELAEPHEVILVDDGSDDGTRAIAERAGVTVLEEDHLGAHVARNRGVAAARGDAIAFTDADCVPQPGWLAAGLRALEEADLVQGAVHPDPGVDMGPFDRSLWVVQLSPFFESANLFVRRDLFERLGGFEALYGPEIGGRPLGEDLWLGWRARRAGARIAFAPDALVHHAVFREGPPEYVLERLRLRYFPGLVAKVPELREDLCFARVFLSAHTAAFDAAVAGAATALARRSWWPLVAALPYAAMALAETRYWGRQAPLAALGGAGADAVGLVSLVRGSLRERTLVL